MTHHIAFVSWDGKSTPFENIIFDVQPAFALVLFCYTGAGDALRVPSFATLINKKTACKGEIYSAVIDQLETRAPPPHYVGLLDDDVQIAVSSINAMLADACNDRLGSFAASLSADSIAAHDKFRQRHGSAWRDVPWVEVMAPFYEWSLIKAAKHLIAGNISSYGIDQFVFPTLQKLIGSKGARLYDCCSMRHMRPITSDKKRFANGLTAHQERVLLRKRCMALVQKQTPGLVGSAWWYDCFAPWDGPASFLLLRIRQLFSPTALRRTLKST